jgi:hypothetical protein
MNKTYDDLLAELEWLHKVSKENLVYLLEYIANYFDK